MRTRKRAYETPPASGRKHKRTKPAAAKRNYIPEDAAVDVFKYLDRYCLDRLQQTCRQFSHIVTTQMTLLCLRTITFAKVKNCWTTGHWSTKASDQIGEKLLTVREIQYENDNEAAIMRLFLSAIQSSLITEKLSFDLHGPPMTLQPLRSAFVQGVLKFNEHRFHQGNSIRNFLGAFARVEQISVMTSKGLSDMFLRYCLHKRIRSIYNVAAKCKRVTDEGIVHFCFGGEPFAKPRVLNIEGPTVTARFLHRVIQAHNACTHNGSFYLVVTRFLKKLPKQELNEYAGNATSANRYTFTGVDGNVLRIEISTFSEKIVVRRNCNETFEFEF
ncbi:hypothetical protein AAVH_09277 [Aphelenchoides avenae]|nr:hypothetical protein AAVH_09277 [Aphelenchus avenae]